VSFSNFNILAFNLHLINLF